MKGWVFPQFSLGKGIEIEELWSILIKLVSDELILAGKLQLKKLQKMKPEKIQPSTGLEPVPPRY